MQYRIGLGQEMILSDRNLPEAADDQYYQENLAFRNAYKQIGKCSMLANMLEIGQKDEFLKYFSEMAEALRTVKSRNYNPALEIYYSIAMVLLNYINRRNITEKIAFRTGLHKLTRVDEHRTWQEAVDYLFNLVKIIFEFQQEEEEKRAIDAITQIQNHVSAHLDGDLSLSRLADLVYLNPTYLSRLFKQESGGRHFRLYPQPAHGKGQDILADQFEENQRDSGGDRL